MFPQKKVGRWKQENLAKGKKGVENCGGGEKRGHYMLRSSSKQTFTIWGTLHELC